MNMRESSRATWASQSTVEHINAGSLQRIADATEKMAVNHIQLTERAKAMEGERDYWRDRAVKLQASNSALRGVITKLKKK